MPGNTRNTDAETGKVAYISVKMEPGRRFLLSALSQTVNQIGSFCMERPGKK